MTQQQCSACGGVFTPTLPNGLTYFHVCPPLSAWQIRLAIAEGQSPLSPAQTKQLAAADAASPPADDHTPALSLGNAYLQSLALHRVGHRNENVDPDKVTKLRDAKTGNLPKDVDDETLMVSVGAGVVELADADA